MRFDRARDASGRYHVSPMGPGKERDEIMGRASRRKRDRSGMTAEVAA
jgi:hypothetical protein